MSGTLIVTGLIYKDEAVTFTGIAGLEDTGKKTEKYACCDEDARLLSTNY